MKNTFETLEKFKKPFIFTSSQMSNMQYSPYDMCKNIGALYTKILGGLKVQLWNVYGNEYDPAKFHVITDCILHAYNSKKINVLTDGQEQRQFLYVEDCCEALYNLYILYDKLPRDKEYHVTSFEWSTISEVAEIVNSYIGNVDISYSDEKDDVQKNKQNNPNPYILRYWKPKTTLKQGIGYVTNNFLTK